MARTLSATVTTEAQKPVTRPGYLLEIPGILTLNSRNSDLTWGTATYSGANEFSISGLNWDYTGAQKGSVSFNDTNLFSMATIILSNDMAGKPVNIYLFYQGAVTGGVIASADVTQVFAGIIDVCEISADGRVTMSLTSEQLVTMNSPRRYIKPGTTQTGFNWVPPAGTILQWGSDTVRIGN